MRILMCTFTVHFGLQIALKNLCGRTLLPSLSEDVLCHSQNRMHILLLVVLSSVQVCLCTPFQSKVALQNWSDHTITTPLYLTHKVVILTLTFYHVLQCALFPDVYLCLQFQTTETLINNHLRDKLNVPLF